MQAATIHVRKRNIASTPFKKSTVPTAGRKLRICRDEFANRTAWRNNPDGDCEINPFVIFVQRRRPGPQLGYENVGNGVLSPRFGITNSCRGLRSRLATEIFFTQDVDLAPSHSTIR